MTRSSEECSRDLTGTEKCANEGCIRPVERGEKWCPTCGLDRALYRREARRSVPAATEPPARGEAGRR
jgi:hypothetical protein